MAIQTTFGNPVLTTGSKGDELSAFTFELLPGDGVIITAHFEERLDLGDEEIVVKKYQPYVRSYASLGGLIQAAGQLSGKNQSEIESSFADVAALLWGMKQLIDAEQAQ